MNNNKQSKQDQPGNRYAVFPEKVRVGIEFQFMGAVNSGGGTFGSVDPERGQADAGGLSDCS